MEVLKIFANLVQIVASPGGIAALERLFSEGGITIPKTLAIIAALPPPTPLPGDGDQA